MLICSISAHLYEVSVMVDTVPPWLASQRADLGQEEIPGSANNPRIIAKARLPGVRFPNVDGLVAYGNGYTSDDKQAWCGAETGGSLAEVGIPPPFNKADNYKSYFWADSFITFGVPCDMRVGAICPFGSHVGMVDEIIDADTFWCIGGNQGSPNGGAVTRSKRTRSSVKSFRWPDDASLQKAGLIQWSLSAAPGAVTSTTRPLIKLSATGGFVTELQKILGLPATGIFDAATDAAVRAFQKSHGLDDDGEVGPKTWGVLLGGTVTIAGDVPHGAEYADDWARMTIAAAHADEIDSYASHVAMPNKARYQAAVAGTNVPWWFVAIIHMRESGGNFSKNIHNGQALGQVTTIEPLGRGPFASFEASVHDWIALKALDHIASWPLERAAYQCELNNGMGYRNKGVPSAYLWSFSNIYQGGKYVSDHVWSATATDQQCGTMPLLRKMMELDASIVFPSAQKPIDGEVLPPLQPGQTQPSPSPSPSGTILLYLLAQLVTRKPMSDPQQAPAAAPAAGGLDLSKLLALLRDPTLQKLISNQPVTLNEMLAMDGQILGAILGKSLPLLALPAPAAPAMPAAPDANAPAAPASPAVATPVLQRPSVQASIVALGAGLVSMVEGWVGTPFGMGHAPTAGGDLAVILPTVSAAFGAAGGWAGLGKLALKAIVPLIAMLPK
jgi:lysozyme family protein/peptidoglycan hydrolase-like protein with peptidoglycan-binding domain